MGAFVFYIFRSMIIDMLHTMMTKKTYRWLLIIIGTLVFVGCCVLSFFAGKSRIVPLVSERPIRQTYYQTGEYKFIDPLLVINRPQTTQFVDMKKDVVSFIDHAQNQGALSDASFFFKDLTTSEWFAVNEQEKYTPASMLKVLTMIAYFKYAETHPEILKTQLYYDGKTNGNLQESFKSPHYITVGWYSVDDLISAMIKYSDNNAAMLLNQHLNDLDYHQLNQPLLDLGIDTINPSDDFMTITKYALIFRVLYNSTYLSRSSSERALELLSQTDFVDGIIPGVPKNINVAHKFGEVTLQDQNHEVVKRELHDCGIVYDEASHSYLLCVMTKGTDFQSLKKVIAGLSSIVFTHPDRIKAAHQQ